ncbi:MAG: right-handed parallel beta-helix repeat-containing protein [Lacipirellulaceae bacterium]
MSNHTRTFRTTCYAAIASCAVATVATGVETSPVRARDFVTSVGWTGATLRVPGEFTTVQAAVDAANSSDTVLVAPGVYSESVAVAGKRVRLLGDAPAGAEGAILDGGAPPGSPDDGPPGDDADDNEHLDGRRSAVIDVDRTAAGSEIANLVIRGGDDGVACRARITIRDCVLSGNVDAIDYEGGGGVCRDNLFFGNEDDAVDLDDESSALVERNRMLDNGDDGVEIRLHPYRGETLTIVLRDNVIAGNREDGVQVIDYPGVSDRRIEVLGNVLYRNKMAGIGFMADANTVEDYSAAEIPEPVVIRGNTFAGNGRSVSVAGRVEIDANYTTLDE